MLADDIVLGEKASIAVEQQHTNPITALIEPFAEQTVAPGGRIALQPEDSGVGPADRQAFSGKVELGGLHAQAFT